jgi:carbonic anhydrase
MSTTENSCPIDNLSAQAALNKLIEGNERYIADHLEHPHEDAQRRVELSRTQHPFAVVLGCADSRVIPELIFDQGIGDIFTIRIAGGVPGDGVIASIEYAIEQFGTQLVVVVGHERCGAVTAAIKHEAVNGKGSSLMRFIEPAVQSILTQPGDLLTNAIQAHAKRTVDILLRQEPILRNHYENGSLAILPAYYHLATGKVDFLSEIKLHDRDLVMV